MRRIILFVSALAVIGGCGKKEVLITEPGTSSTPPPASLSVSVTVVGTMVAGDSSTAKAMTSPASGVSVSWSSSSPSTATVNQGTGFVTAIAPGTSWIKATAVSGSQVKSDSAKITVNARTVPALSVVAVSKTATVVVGDTGYILTFKLNVPGKTQVSQSDTLKYSVTSPSTITYTRLTRASSVDSLPLQAGQFMWTPRLVVTETVRVNGKLPGLSKLIASANADATKSDSTSVTVNAAPVQLGIKMSPDSVRLKVGQSMELPVTITAATGVTKIFTCASPNPGVVSVFTDLTKGVCRAQAIVVNPLGTNSPVEVYAQTLAVDPILGLLRYGVRVYVDP